MSELSRRVLTQMHPSSLKQDVLAALERAAEVAEQGCNFCSAMVDDLGEDRDGGREAYAHWWACGECWNRSARETSTTIRHLSDLLDAALERVVLVEANDVQAADEVGHLREALNDEMYARDAERQRAERMEKAARSVERRIRENADNPGPGDVVRIHASTMRPWADELRAALADAPGEKALKLGEAVDEIIYEIRRMIGLKEVPQLSQIEWWANRLTEVDR